MKTYQRLLVLFGLALASASCAEAGPSELGVVRERLAAPAVRISELHYDNVGADVGESIEVSGPAGMDLTGWKLVLYNGAGGASYSPLITLSGLVPATCGERGVVVLPAVGLQNGSPDGVALVDAGGNVVEFLSYEGTMTATNGPANGLTSTDIGVSEPGTGPVGESLARNADGTWNASAPNSFGSCNDNGATPPDGTPPDGTPPDGTPPSLPDVRLSELHYDNAGVDSGEAIEIEGPVGTDLSGWSLVLYDGTPNAVDGLRKAYGTQTLNGAIPATCGERGVVVVNYPSNGIQNGSPDGVALVNGSGSVVEFLSYEGVFVADDGPAAGLLSVDIVASEAASSSLLQSLQRDASNQWALADRSFGGCNADGPTPVSNSISFSGRVPTDPALPVGFQDQLFATLRDPSGAGLTSTFVWSSDTPDIASIDADGVMTALAVGSAILRATAQDGTSASYALPTRVAVASTTAIYAGNTEFGEPTDADPSDDVIVRHPEYTASYNPTRGTPNWVAYDLEASHFGAEDRCDCFTFDPALPASFVHYTTADYTGAGAFHGFGIDRGHMARSFDRTSSSLDNAFTFYFTNVVPQASDLNQGPWALFENELGDLARFQDKEVYIIAGVAGNQGTLKNQGKIVIPESTWKVALIMPHDQGLANVADYRDLQVMAVNMPNHAGVRNVPWQTYLTTVDAVEAVSGYDLLALLPDRTEAAVESGTQPPLAKLDGPYSSQAGDAVAMSAAGSLDPNGTIASHVWSFGDGTSANGDVVSHSYAEAGTYQVALTVTDDDGLTDTVTTSAVVSAKPAPPAPTIHDAVVLVDGLSLSGRLGRAVTLLLRRELGAAQLELDRQRPRAAALVLLGIVQELDALVRLHTLSATDAAPLRALLFAVIQSLSR